MEFKEKADKEMCKKTNEICELKLHLDHLQQYNIYKKMKK